MRLFNSATIFLLLHMLFETSPGCLKLHEYMWMCGVCACACACFVCVCVGGGGGGGGGGGWGGGGGGGGGYSAPMHYYLVSYADL